MSAKKPRPAAKNLPPITDRLARMQRNPKIAKLSVMDQYLAYEEEMLRPHGPTKAKPKQG